MKVKATVHASYYYKVEIDVPDSTSFDDAKEKVVEYYCEELPDPDYMDIDLYDIDCTPEATD